MVSKADDGLSDHETDIKENDSLMGYLENTILPMYYQDKAHWLRILKNAAHDVVPAFEAGRMANEYYEKMYNA